MRIPFTKMHGLGNDFVVVQAADAEPPAPEQIRRLGDRKRGIGFDQLLWLQSPHSNDVDVYYRIFNPDGSEAEQCGNGARCIARLIDDGQGRELRLAHARGVSRARVKPDGMVTAEMGVPEFSPGRIPFLAEREQLDYEIDADGKTVCVGVVSMGNPHAVLMVKDVDRAPVDQLGPVLERHARFPNRANIGFAQVIEPERIRLRVFERGVGETQACGTGACAAAVLGHRAGRLSERVAVELPGGELTVCWKGPGAPVWLSGEAVTVFEGTVQI